MEIKYTSDGKKVAVIGKLNSQETIVQEIFISGDAEIPSGDNFVVKSLHDAPSKSWKETKLLELEARYAKDKKQYETALRESEAQFKVQLNKFNEKTKYLKLVDKSLDVRCFDRMVMFINGQIKYFVTDGYVPKLEKVKDFNFTANYGGLKLLTLFGRDDGTMNWGIDTYSDGSGGNRTQYYFFKSKAAAVKKFKEIISSKDRISEGLINLAKEYGVQLDAKKVFEYQVDTSADLQKQVENRKNDIEELEKRINRINQI